MALSIDAAAATIRPYVRRTPVLRAEVDGRPLVLKLEHLQRSGSFKLRGAVNALAGERPARVVTPSGGNHGLGVATAAELLGLAATVYVPDSVPEGKARRIEAAGAKLVRVPGEYADAAAAAMAADEPGSRYVSAYDDPLVVAGQGTVAAEVVEDVPEVDAFAVAVGGGGLAAGTALAIGSRRLYTVEPEGCDALHAALRAGGPVDVEVDSVAASALGTRRVGDVPFGILSAVEPVPLLVRDKDILAARDRLWEEFRLAVEPAAAAPFAAWLDGRIDARLPCLVVCGANTGWTPSG